LTVGRTVVETDANWMFCFQSTLKNHVSASSCEVRPLQT